MSTKHPQDAEGVAIQRSDGLSLRPDRRVRGAVAESRDSRTALRVAVTVSMLAAALTFGAAGEVLALTAVPPAGTATVVPTPRPGQIPVVHRTARR